MASLTGLFRICKDAVLRYTPVDNRPVTNLLLAFDYGGKGDDGRRPTQFVDAELWGKRAEDLAQYLKKGGEVTCIIDDPHVTSFARTNGTPSLRMVGRINQIDLGRRPAGDRGKA